MAITRRAADYQVDGQVHDGLLVSAGAGAPTILVFHGWEGRSEGQDEFCERLAAAGYSAFAVDLYGKGKRGTTTEECQALMTPFVADRAMLRGKLLAHVKAIGELDGVNAQALGAIGFCFGGLCNLDLARAGAPIKGVASFHGLFGAPDLPTAAPIAAKVIAFHGWDDPMVPPADVVALGQELTAAGADWQIHAHGGAMHAFMNVGADMPEMGILYNARTAGRAWTALLNFLGEVFA
jgi:dienelactone hydrolase